MAPIESLILLMGLCALGVLAGSAICFGIAVLMVKAQPQEEPDETRRERLDQCLESKLEPLRRVHGIVVPMPKGRVH